MFCRSFALLALAFALTTALPAQVIKTAEIVKLTVKDQGPHFSGLTDQGEKWDSKEHAGKKNYVVYFYPADMTPGCTAQACAYRDALAELKRDDVEVIGVSGDSVENHQHFRDQYKLNFTLLADPEGKIAKAFGVKISDGGSFQRNLSDKEITFERGVTAGRWTFIIDKDWRIAHFDRKVNAAKDSDKVLKIVEKLP
ncbi:MAG: peroxiredoxin [Aeoliella sp.]